MNFGAPELGTLLVWTSLFFAGMGSALGFRAGATGSPSLWTWARNAAYGFAVPMILANLTMVWALVTHDFSVQYVSEVGSLSTPIYFTIVSLWASLNGSILFWGGILAVYTVLFVGANGDRHREYMPWTLGMLLAVSVFFVLLVSSVANPFERVLNPLSDGPGPNPLLQNHWLMAVHPPTLYLGYVGMVVPFSMICASLFAGRLEDGWMVPLRRWMLVPWTFLTIGIVLGGWWSYGVLGWGGYWAWDPVENASFHPWLTATAFLHSAMVFQKRGALRVWTLTLGLGTFLLTLVGTFMTRSGVFNSVHSFTQSPIGPVFLVFIAVTLVFSVVLLALREHTLTVEDDHAHTTLMASVLGFRAHLLGRELSLVLQNVAFTVFTFTVLLGTLLPLLREAYDGTKISVGEPYFDRWAMPIGLLIVFLMGVGPALPWGRMPANKAAAKLATPTMVGLTLAALLWRFGFGSAGVLVTAALCGFAFQANLGEFLAPVLARRAQRGESLVEAARVVFVRTRRRWGGLLAHLGVVIVVLAMALSKGYKTETDLTLHPGEHKDLGRFGLTFQGGDVRKEPHRTSAGANFEVFDGGASLGVFRPHMNYYPTQREPIFTPEVVSTLTSDFYLSIVELDKAGTYVVVRTITMPGVVWLWIGAGVIALGAVIVLWPDSRAARAIAATPDPAATPASPTPESA